MHMWEPLLPRLQDCLPDYAPAAAALCLLALRAPVCSCRGSVRRAWEQLRKEQGCVLSLPWEMVLNTMQLSPGPLHVHPDQIPSRFPTPKAANCSEVLRCSFLLSHRSEAQLVAITVYAFLEEVDMMAEATGYIHSQDAK